MKEMINYYYKLYPDKIYNVNDYKYFFDNESKYYIIKISRNNYNEIEKIFDICVKKSISVNKIVYNINNELLTSYSKKAYIIIETIDIEDMDIILDDIEKYNVDIDNDIKESIIKNYCDKVDTLEEEYNEYKDENNYISKTFNYHIGLAENAISYISDAFKECEHPKNTLIHKTISKNHKYSELIDIMNIKIGFHIEDISNYFRGIILYDEDWENIINNYLSKRKLLEFEYRLLYGIIVFPLYYFDGLIGKQDIDKEKIVLNESKLNNLYNIINNYYSIPSIKWINNK